MFRMLFILKFLSIYLCIFERSKCFDDCENLLIETKLNIKIMYYLIICLLYRSLIFQAHLVW